MFSKHHLIVFLPFPFGHGAFCGACTCSFLVAALFESIDASQCAFFTRGGGAFTFTQFRPCGGGFLGDAFGGAVRVALLLGVVPHAALGVAPLLFEPPAQVALGFGAALVGLRLGAVLFTKRFQVRLHDAPAAVGAVRFRGVRRFGFGVQCRVCGRVLPVVSFRGFGGFAGHWICIDDKFGYRCKNKSRNSKTIQHKTNVERFDLLIFFIKLWAAQSLSALGAALDSVPLGGGVEVWRMWSRNIRRCSRCAPCGRRWCGCT